MEIRPVKGGDFLMSPAYKQDVVGLHFTWFKYPEKVKRAIAKVQEWLRGDIVAVHWAKLFYLNEREVREMYQGRVSEFKSLQRRMDPRGVFINSFFLDRFGWKLGLNKNTKL